MITGIVGFVIGVVVGACGTMVVALLWAAAEGDRIAEEARDEYGGTVAELRPDVRTEEMWR